MRPRWLFLTEAPIPNVVHGLALVTAGVLLAIPLGLVPFSNTLPAVASLCLSLGLLERDRLLIVAGYMMIVATVVYFGMLAAGAVLAGHSLLTLIGRWTRWRDRTAPPGVYWRSVPSCRPVQLLVIVAIAIAHATAGIRVGGGEALRSSEDGWPDVTLRSTATVPVVGLRAKDGDALVFAFGSGPRRSWLQSSAGAPRSSTPELPNPLRDALRHLPLASRPPPLA